MQRLTGGCDMARPRPEHPVPGYGDLPSPDIVRRSEPLHCKWVRLVYAVQPPGDTGAAMPVLSVLPSDSESAETVAE